MHQYKATVTWTGNEGLGTQHYTQYSRNHEIAIDGKATIAGSADPAFRGDSSKHNPEDLLVASLSSCHMLWYLHLCAVDGIVVESYSDEASGTMIETAETGGHFTEVVLHPIVKVKEASMVEKANALHHKAHALCFIANSVNFTVRHEPMTFA